MPPPLLLLQDISITFGAAPGLPNLLALANVGDEDRHFDDIGHATAGRLDQMADLGEDRLRLGVLVSVSARRHPAV